MTDSSRESTYSVKSEGATSQSSEFNDYTLVTMTHVESTQCDQSYIRQYSTSENREGLELMCLESVDNTCIRNESVENAKDNRSQETSPDEIKIDLDRSGVPSDHATRSVTQTGAQESSSQLPARSVSGNCVAKEKIFRKQKRNSFHRLNCTCHFFSIVLSLAAIGGVGYMLITNKYTIQPVSTESTDRMPAQSLALQDMPKRVVGRFKLDRDAFVDSNSTQIRWKTAGALHSSITASLDNNCLIVPVSGTYGVFSVLTFSIEKEDTVKRLVSILRLWGYQKNEQFFHRKIVAVRKREDRNNPETIPISIVSFVGMEANGQICIETSDDVIKYLYASTIDNTVNIFKV